MLLFDTVLTKVYTEGFQPRPECRKCGGIVRFRFRHWKYDSRWPEYFTYKVKGNNGVDNSLDRQPPGDPPINDGRGTGPGDPGNRGGK